MQAIFRLTAAQAEEATALEAAACAAAVAQGEAEGFALWCGIYAISRHACTNPIQWVGLGDEPLTLVVEGQRCALDYDGGFAAAKKMLGDKPNILSYKTSDPRLRWDETLSAFMRNRAPFPTRVEYALGHRAERWEHLLPEMRPIVAALRRGERIAAAQYAPPEIRLARIFAGR